jgi:hypothetical protein
MLCRKTIDITWTAWNTYKQTRCGQNVQFPYVATSGTHRHQYNLKYFIFSRSKLKLWQVLDCLKCLQHNATQPSRRTGGASTCQPVHTFNFKSDDTVRSLYPFRRTPLHGGASRRSVFTALTVMKMKLEQANTWKKNVSEVWGEATPFC